MPKEVKAPRITIASLQADLVAARAEIQAMTDSRDRERLAKGRLITAAFNGKDYGTHDHTADGAVEKMYELHRTLDTIHGRDSDRVHLIQEENERLWSYIFALSGV